jgi:hypothetical protein
MTEKEYNDKAFDLYFKKKKVKNKYYDDPEKQKRVKEKKKLLERLRLK